MRTNIFKLCNLAVAVILMAGCNDDDVVNGFSAQEGDNILFSVGSESTRTVYNESDSWQIDWLTDETDQIRIFCEQAKVGDDYEVNHADYTVDPNHDFDGDGINGVKVSGMTQGSANTTIADYVSYKNGYLVPNTTSGLQWTSAEEYTFYATYPANDQITVDEDGIACFPINRNQICTYDKLENGVHLTKPDMKNAYMVANTTAKRSEAVGDYTINLGFSPIMTTLEVTIQGQDANDNAGSMKVTGMSVITTFTTTEAAEASEFYYDIPNGKITRKPGTTAGNTTTTTVSNTTYVGIENGTEDAVSLAGGEKLKLTVFLPPSNPDLVNYSIQIRVHVAGSTELKATIDPKSTASNITASSKRRITLPLMPNPLPVGNNWITPLDGKIYVSQLSIPGSHDAATGEEMASIIGDMFAKTQEQTLSTQWDLGIRCFDLRPAIYDATFGSTNELWLYHGMTRVSISWATAMNTIKTKLTNNPGEFAIILFRHEDESTIGKNNDTSDFNTYMTNWINANSSWIVDWKPNLTIEECRGKIILISRFSGTWSYGAFTGWNHDEVGADSYVINPTTIKNASGSQTGSIYIQDDYDFSNYTVKYNGIVKMLNISETFHTNSSLVNTWMINHVSGYLNSSTSDTYRANSAEQNPKIFGYIKSEDWKGSTGILMFDYSGAAISGNYNVQGDIMLQSVIDNNYKYVMKRAE